MTVGTAGFASRVMNYRPQHWFRLHDTSASGTNIGDSVVLNTQSNGIVAWRGAVDVRQLGPLHASQISYSEVFDGSTDAIEISQSSSLLSGTSGSFFAFYKKSALATAGTIIGGISTNKEVSVVVNAAGAPVLTLKLSAGNDSVTTATNGFVDDLEWHFLVITSDGATAPKIYIDGVLCSSSNVLQGSAVAGSWFNYVGTTSWDIGRKANTGVNDGTVYWKGSLSEIGHVAATVWTLADIEYIYAGKNYIYGEDTSNFNDLIVEKYWQIASNTSYVAPGLTCYANFDEPSGNVNNNGWHGDTSTFWTANGTAPTRQVAGSGIDVLNYGLSFPGTGNSRIIVGSASYGRYFISTLETKGALFFIIKCNSTQANNGFICDIHGAGVQTAYDVFTLSLTSATGRVRLFQSNSLNTASRDYTWTNASLKDDDYHFIAIVQRGDGTGVHCFIDGVEQAISGGAPTVVGTLVTADSWAEFLSFGGGSSSLAAFHTLGNNALNAVYDHFSSVGNVVVTDADITALEAARAFSVSFGASAGASGGGGGGQSKRRARQQFAAYQFARMREEWRRKNGIVRPGDH